MSGITAPFFFELPTKIEYGPGCLKTLPAHLTKLGGKKPIIITDKGIVGAGLLTKVTARVKKEQTRIFGFARLGIHKPLANVHIGRLIADDYVLRLGSEW